MSVISAAGAPEFTLPHATFTGLASPSRGAKENAVWRVVVAPGSPGGRHYLSHEEIFVAIKGSALAHIGDVEHVVNPGDALVVPKEVEFNLTNPHAEPFEAVVVFPVGGKANLPGGEPFTPPWAE
jgi:mannose-6-phosphate isomerase-like protein (cupin superfamily)